MDDEYKTELNKWREGVDGFIAESNLYRRATAIRMDAMEKNLEANTAMTTEMHTGLSEAIPVILDFKGAARTVKRLGRAAKPLVYIGSFAVAVVVYLKTGEWRLP